MFSIYNDGPIRLDTFGTGVAALQRALDIRLAAAGFRENQRPALCLEEVRSGSILLVLGLCVAGTGAGYLILRNVRWSAEELRRIIREIKGICDDVSAISKKGAKALPELQPETVREVGDLAALITDPGVSHVDFEIAAGDEVAKLKLAKDDVPKVIEFLKVHHKK